MSSKFDAVVKIVEEMGKKENSKKTGFNLKFKGDDGKTYNISDKNMKFGPISIGKTYSFQGDVLDGEHPSKWISSYVEVGVPAVHAHQQLKTDEKHNDAPGTIESWRKGQALNLGMMMLHQSGGAPQDQDYMDKWFAFADKALKATYVYEAGAGKFEVPF